MGNKVDIAVDSLSKDEQIELLQSMLASAERGFAAEIESMKAAFAAQMAAEHAKFAFEKAQLTERLELLIEQIRIANARRFGASSERILPEQLALFNDMEAAWDGGLREPELERGASEKKARRAARRINTDNMPRTVIEHVLEGEGLVCQECGSEMTEMRVDVREVVKLVPAHFEVEEHRMHVYICSACSRKNTEGQEVPVSIARSEMPRLPLEKSWAHPSLIAGVINSKYVNAMPLYRIQADLKSIDPNMEVSRQCMAGWVIAVHERWLTLIHERIRVQILSGDLVHMDETTTLVLKEPGRLASSKSYMWVMASPKGAMPACSFEYDPSRSAKVCERLLSGWSGTLMTDCYAAYFSLSGIKNLACLVHIRREFLEVVKGLDPRKVAGINSLAADGANAINHMFSIDRKFADMTPEKRKAARETQLRPAMERFGAWLAEHVGEVVPKSKLGRAFGNAIEHWPHVMRVLDDGRFPLDNNLAERFIRPFVIGRVNWMFSDTQNGAHASAAIYSIVATARANGLIPGRYIEWLLTVMPNTEDVRNPEVLDSFMPWSAQVPDWVRAEPGTPRIAPDDPIVEADPYLLESE